MVSVGSGSGAAGTGDLALMMGGGVGGAHMTGGGMLKGGGGGGGEQIGGGGGGGGVLLSEGFLLPVCPWQHCFVFWRLGERSSFVAS